MRLSSNVFGSLQVGEVRRQKGAELIEFALVLPIFLLLAFGILYFGIYLFTQQSVKNAAQEGANAAVVVDVDSAGNDLSSLVLARVNARVASSLSFMPGHIDELQAGAIATNGQCGGAGASGFVCISGPDSDGSYDVAIRLTPRFSSLWPGFPDLLPFLTGGDAGSDRIEAQARGRLTAGS